MSDDDLDRSSAEEDEAALFRRALREAGVERLKAELRNRADPGRRKSASERDAIEARRRAAETLDRPLDAPSRLSDGRVEPVSPSQPLLFALNDLDQRLITRLKRGEIEWQAGLDLHGYSVEEARRELEGFLGDALEQRLRCVLVVHGKAWSAAAGHPLIKSHVNAWLREWPEVLAFSSATPVDGGTGALYVLLKRTR